MLSHAIFFSKVFLPSSVCEMDTVCLMNRCSLFCTICGLRPYFLRFIQSLTLKSKWFFSSGAFHDSHHSNIWIVAPKTINLPSQHPWAMQVLSVFYKQVIKAEWAQDQYLSVQSDEFKTFKTLSAWVLFVSLYSGTKY